MCLHVHGMCTACAWQGGEGADFFMIVHGAVTVNIDSKTEYPARKSASRVGASEKGK